MSADGAPLVLQIGETVGQQELKIEAPRRFGCRADITGKGIVFRGEFAAICGGKMVTFMDGDQGCPQPFETLGGFQYGAIFITSIAPKILTYSEDGIVALWAPHS
jgi:hypothetical protein